MSAEQQFERELEIFRKNSEGAAQYFYGYLAMHEVATSNLQVLGYLNKSALLWAMMAGALQTAALVALHRIFNSRSRHNGCSLLRTVDIDRSIFSRNALRERKRGKSQKDPEWLDAYMRETYEPKVSDFRRLRVRFEKYKKLYESNYAPLRNKVFAHTVASDVAEIKAIAAKTNIREMERMVVFLLKMHDALWQLYFNGNRPALKGGRYSIGRILNSKIPPRGCHENIAKEMKQVLLVASSGFEAPGNKHTQQ